MAVTKTHPIKSTLKAAIYEELLDRSRQRPSLLPVSKWASGDIRAKIDRLALKDEARRHLPPAQANS